MSLSYPGGDPPREKGVCTDVIIRALRDALGMDLQKLVHEDMKKAFADYPQTWGLTKTDRNIDHRRVPNLMAYFKRKGYAVPITNKPEDYTPGDFVTCTVRRNLPHIMIVSDRVSADGTPLVIHNIGGGAQEEDRLFSFPITGHYRIAAPAVVQPQNTALTPETASTKKTVHVLVALCDNESQGIVPVPAKLGNGTDPANNLYWGAMYGTKTFLRNSSSWKYLGEQPVPDSNILERIVFKAQSADAYLVADAYRGDRIKKAVEDLLRAAGGNDGKTLQTGGASLGLGGKAAVVVYVGHNGLMDVKVEPQERAASGRPVPSIVLACKSESYFRARLEALGSRPVLLTTGFMAPEAYTLDAAVRAWLSGSSASEIREQAASAYNAYQRCGMNGARRLFWTE
jgi:uncharacterized protein YijF (DUF1287 family)